MHYVNHISSEITFRVWIYNPIIIPIIPVSSERCVSFSERNKLLVFLRKVPFGFKFLVILFYFFKELINLVYGHNGRFYTLPMCISLKSYYLKIAYFYFHFISSFSTCKIVRKYSLVCFFIISSTRSNISNFDL